MSKGFACAEQDKPPKSTIPFPSFDCNPPFWNPTQYKLSCLNTKKKNHKSKCHEHISVNLHIMMLYTEHNNYYKTECNGILSFQTIVLH